MTTHTADFDIERPAHLIPYLQRHGRIHPDEAPTCTPLHGGVSNRTVLLRRRDGTAWVLKQALGKLRVKDDWYADPARIDREALGLRWLPEITPPGATPAFLFADPDIHLVAMAAVPEPHVNWKSRLLAGDVSKDLTRQFGSLLGTLHREGAARCLSLQPIFEDRTHFHQLRILPYYRATADRNSAAAAFFERLILDTNTTATALVHGDFSPKNILVHRDRLVLLDFEVIHWGDPAFDLGFALTHFLSKAHHLPASRATLIDAAGTIWKAYQSEADALAVTPGFESRIVRHTVACLLARVDGRSPLEYLQPPELDRQRAAALALIHQLPQTVDDLLSRWPALIDRDAGKRVEP